VKLVRSLATDADNAALPRRPALVGPSHCEEGTDGRRAGLAPEADRVIARANAGDDERQSRHPRMVETERPKQSDSPVAGWPGGPLMGGRASKRHRDQIDTHAREWRVAAWRRDVEAFSPMRSRRGKPQGEVAPRDARRDQADRDREQSADDKGAAHTFYMYGLPGSRVQSDASLVREFTPACSSRPLEGPGATEAGFGAGRATGEHLADALWH
jgi:hypothetical protein